MTLGETASVEQIPDMRFVCCLDYNYAECMSAGYLGYADVADFRKFRFHWVVLTWFLVYAPTCQGTRAENAMSLIKEIEESAKDFPEDIGELKKKYPTTEDIEKVTRQRNVEYIYAAVLLYLANAIECMTPEQLTNSAQQRELANRFEESFSPIPPFDLNTIVLPKLGPREEFAEDKMEKYCRVNVLLKSLQQVLFPSR